MNVQQQPLQYSQTITPNEPPPPYTLYPQTAPIPVQVMPVQEVRTQVEREEAERERRRRMISIGMHVAGVPHAGLIGIISRMASNSDEPRPSRAEKRACRREERAERREQRRMERDRLC